MSYLARVAARASGRSTSARLASTLPVSSPLVAFDQRLNVPGFAETTADIASRTPGDAEGLAAAETPSVAVGHSSTEVGPFAVPGRPNPAVQADRPTPEPAVTTSAVELRPRSTRRSLNYVDSPGYEVAPRKADKSPVPREWKSTFAEVDAWMNRPNAPPRAARQSADRPRLESRLARERTESSALPPEPLATSPRLVVGNINVEVIVPERRPALQRPAVDRRTVGARGAEAFGARAASPGFGWRQR